MTEISEKEVEAAREAWREYWSDVIGQYDDNKGPMEGMRRALEAAARVRAEAAEGGEVVASIPLGKGNVIDGGGANISQPLHNKHITIRDREAHPVPQPSGPVGALGFDALRQANVARQKEWPGNGQADIAFRAIEVAGEAGEVLEAVKKFLRAERGIRGSSATAEDIAAEMADAVIALDLLANQLGVDLGSAVVAKFNATSEKYGLATRLSALTAGEPEQAVPSGKIEEAAQIIQAFIDQEVDYMMRNNLGDPEKQHNVKWGRKWLSALTAGKPHPDDEAVDRFAAAMKAKLKWEREERGRHGWNDPSICPESYLARLLIEHLAKGNDGNFEDVANFCMMLHQRGAHPRVLADALTAGKPEQAVPSGWKLVPEEPTEEMYRAVYKVQDDCAIHNYGASPTFDDYWSAALSASPAAPTAGGGDE